jgi:hypothetical protein
MMLPEEKQTQLKQNETKDIACDMLGGTTLKKQIARDVPQAQKPRGPQ